jgi:hypothetical protein
MEGVESAVGAASEAAGAGAEAAAGAADCWAADCCEPASCGAVAEGVVCARDESATTELNKEAAKHFEKAFINISPYRPTWEKRRWPSLSGRLYAQLFRNANEKK